MYFLSFFIEAVSASKNIVTTTSLSVLLFALVGLYKYSKRSKKQQRKLKWQFLRFYINQRVRAKREKADGATIFLLILMLIACVAILWILWALGGIFALILGIVFGLGILALIFRK